MCDGSWPDFHNEPMQILVGDTPETTRMIVLPPGTFEDDMKILCELGIVRAEEVEV